MNGEEPKREMLQWHPTFFADIQIEFREETGKLMFENEHQLGTKPREIDVLIIKKKGMEPIQKNIGRIFRRYNIVEYKSPEDYLSMDDYYKAIGYVCFYKTDVNIQNQITLSEITLTFVCHGYPRKLMRHLQKERQFVVDEADKGIYYVYGDMIPVQIIVTRLLDKEKNLWLGSLTNQLEDAQEAERLIADYAAHRDEELYRSVMDMILTANKEKMGVMKMGNPEETMKQIFEPWIREKEQIAMKEGMERGMKRGMERGMKRGMERGMERGIERGMNQGVEKGLLTAIRNLMETMAFTAEQAMNALKVPEEERGKYAGML